MSKEIPKPKFIKQEINRLETGDFETIGSAQKLPIQAGYGRASMETNEQMFPMIRKEGMSFDFIHSLQGMASKNGIQQLTLNDSNALMDEFSRNYPNTKLAEYYNKMSDSQFKRLSSQAIKEYNSRRHIQKEFDDIKDKIKKQLIPKKIHETVHRGGKVFERERTVMSKPEELINGEDVKFDDLEKVTRILRGSDKSGFINLPPNKEDWLKVADQLVTRGLLEETSREPGSSYLRYHITKRGKQIGQKLVYKEFGSISSGGFTPTYGESSWDSLNNKIVTLNALSDKKKIKDKIENLLDKSVKTMGHFEPPAGKEEKPKFCKHCKKPVRETIGNLGYCKDCLELAKREQKIQKDLKLDPTGMKQIMDKLIKPKPRKYIPRDYKGERQRYWEERARQEREKLHKEMSEITSEAHPQTPKTELQEKVLGKIKYFERKAIQTKIDDIVKDIENRLDEEQRIQQFIKGYERLALLSKMVNDEEISNLSNLANDINILKGYNSLFFNPSIIDNGSRLDKVLFIDDIAHQLHQVKNSEGKSLYRQLDELADISKSLGEVERDTRLLILESPAENKKKLEDLSKMDILHKGKLLEKSVSMWKLFERAVKGKIPEFSNDELVLLREWLFSRI